MVVVVMVAVNGDLVCGEEVMVVAGEDCVMVLVGSLWWLLVLAEVTDDVVDVSGS